MLGTILGMVDLLRKRGADQKKGATNAGLVLNGLALLVGGVRFAISITTTGGIV